MSPDADPTTVCVEKCGGMCCSGGAFLRPEDIDQLVDTGHGDAVADHSARTRTDPSGDCVLLDEDGLCRVYDDRPVDCRLFPLGFELDDEAEVVHIVLVGCPLTEHYTPAERRSLVDKARRLLPKFSAQALRAYDELSFTDSHEQLTTIPYDTIPQDL